MSKIYTVHNINKGTFAIEEKSNMGQGLCYLLCGSEKALLIDTGLGHKGLLEAVEGLTSLPVTVANTHAHIDHIGGNHKFNEICFHEADKPIFELHIQPEYTFGLLTAEMPAALKPIARLLTRRLLQISSAGKYSYFGDDKVFCLGGRDIEVIPTPGHTPGCVCFLDRANRMLFSGDSVCEWGILLHFEKESCTPQTYLHGIQRLKALENEYDSIWPGHHGFPIDKGYIEEYLTCAEQIVNNQATYSVTKGRRCATYKRILITLPSEK